MVDKIRPHFLGGLARCLQKYETATLAYDRNGRGPIPWSRLNSGCQPCVSLVSSRGSRATKWKCFTSTCCVTQAEKESLSAGTGGIMHLHSINFGAASCFFARLVANNAWKQAGYPLLEKAFALQGCQVLHATAAAWYLVHGLFHLHISRVGYKSSHK